MLSGLHTRIIAMTANVMQGDQGRCLEVGMDGHLSKPLKAGGLQSVLRRWAGHAEFETHLRERAK